MSTVSQRIMLRQSRLKATTPAPTTPAPATPEQMLRPSLKDYESFVSNNVVTEDELVLLQNCMRTYLNRPSPKDGDEPLLKRSFNLRGPPKITPKMNGTSRIRTQLYGHRVLQLCGALLDPASPIIPCYDGHQLTFDSELRDKIRAMQKWSPGQLQTAFDRAELERLRDLAASIRPSTQPTRHNKSSRIRYRSVRNELVPSEHFRRSFILYRRPPFKLSTRGYGCRSTLPQKLPPIGKREIWMYPDERGEDSTGPPLTSLKKTPPQDYRSHRMKARPPLKPYIKRRRRVHEIQREMERQAPSPTSRSPYSTSKSPYSPSKSSYSPSKASRRARSSPSRVSRAPYSTSKASKAPYTTFKKRTSPTPSKPARIATQRRRVARTEPLYKKYKTPLPIVSVNDAEPFKDALYKKADPYIGASTSQTLPTDGEPHCLDLRPLTATATATATVTATKNETRATRTSRKMLQREGSSKTTGTRLSTTGNETRATSTSRKNLRREESRPSTANVTTAGNETRAMRTSQKMLQKETSSKATAARASTANATTTITTTGNETRATRTSRGHFQREESSKTIATRPSTTNMLDLDSLLGTSEDKMVSTIQDFGRSVGGGAMLETVKRNPEPNRGIYDSTLLVNNVKTVVCD